VSSTAACVRVRSSISLSSFYLALQLGPRALKRREGASVIGDHERERDGREREDGDHEIERKERVIQCRSGEGTVSRQRGNRGNDRHDSNSHGHASRFTPEGDPREERQEEERHRALDGCRERDPVEDSCRDDRDDHRARGLDALKSRLLSQRDIPQDSDARDRTDSRDLAQPPADERDRVRLRDHAH
jgi:hypothetical protein